MTRWTADVFINSQVGRITTEVEAATYEGARQQIIAKHGQLSQIYGISQASENVYQSSNSPSLHELEVQRQLRSISDELTYQNELEASRQTHQYEMEVHQAEMEALEAHDEVVEGWMDLWDSVNDLQEARGEAPYTLAEMQLMYGDPSDDNIIRMDERLRKEGKVTIECVSCNQSITVPDDRAGRVKCPGCKGRFYVDTTIPFNYERNRRKAREAREAREAQEAQKAQKAREARESRQQETIELVFYSFFSGIISLVIWFFSPALAIFFFICTILLFKAIESL